MSVPLLMFFVAHFFVISIALYIILILMYQLIVGNGSFEGRRYRRDEDMKDEMEWDVEPWGLQRWESWKYASDQIDANAHVQYKVQHSILSYLCTSIFYFARVMQVINAASSVLWPRPTIIFSFSLVLMLGIVLGSNWTKLTDAECPLLEIRRNCSLWSHRSPD